MFSVFSRTLFGNQNLLNFNSKQFHRFAVPIMASFTTTPSSADVAAATNLSVKRVGTHNGSFHCDEALGCFMIRLTDKFSNAQIVRSRDPQVYFLFLCILVRGTTFGGGLFLFLFVYV